MKPYERIVLIIFGSIVILAVFYLSIDYWKHRPRMIKCDGGEREAIDYREIQIKYSSNRISLGVEVMDKLKLTPEIDPEMLQTALESTQNWDQFLKGLISGYNSCAISKNDYGLILQRYKKIEDITRSLTQLLHKSPLSDQDAETAKKLIEQYSLTGRELIRQ
jgi:hypothetical protein